IVDLALQFHERVQQRFRPRRTTGNVNVHWNVPVDSLEHVVTLLEWSAGNRARAHRDHVLRVRHLVVEPDDLRRHFLRHRAGDNHQIRLARRWAENFSSEPRDVVTRGRGRDHFDRATRQTKLQRPDRIFAAPIVKLLHRRDPNALSLQFAAQSLVDFVAHYFAQFKQPFPQAQTSPSISNKRNTKIDKNAPTGNPVNATANGTRKTASTSKIKKMMA